MKTTFALIVFLLPFLTLAQPENNVVQEVNQLLASNQPMGLIKARQELQQADRNKDFRTAAMLSSLLSEAYQKAGDVNLSFPYHADEMSYAKASGDSALILQSLVEYASVLVDDLRLTEAQSLLAEAENYLQANLSEQLRWYQTKASYSFKLMHLTDAINFYNKGFSIAMQNGENDKAMNFQLLIGHAMFYKGKVDSIHLVYDALDYFEKKKNYGFAAFAAMSIGMSYQFAFNNEKALQYYDKAFNFANLTNDASKATEIKTKIGEIYLAQKKYDSAKKFFVDVLNFYNQKNDALRLALAHIFLGRLYTETNELVQAEACFNRADSINKIIKRDNLTIISAGNRILLSAKQKNYKKTDSLIAKAVHGLAKKNVDPDVVNNAARKVKEGNTATDLLTKEVNHTFKTGKTKRADKYSLTEDEYKELQHLNSYSGYDKKDDSSLVEKANRQLLLYETQHHTTALTDSLQQQKHQTQVAKEELQARNKTIAAVAILLLLVSTGLWLQYHHRKRAERDKQRIEMLQNEIHHRVKNNLAVINRLVDVAGKNVVYEAPLDALKTRIKSIELLHQHLYSKEANVGNISLQSYFEDLCTAIAATFETAKEIRFRVEASIEVESTIAEKLGLILNELVTNSFKHAFADKGNGCITIKASHNKNELKLIVEDNGIGMPKEKENSYGMKLIKGLSHELKGKFSFCNADGTQFQLSIPA